MPCRMTTVSLDAGTAPVSQKLRLPPAAGPSEPGDRGCSYHLWEEEGSPRHGRRTHNCLWSSFRQTGCMAFSCVSVRSARGSRLASPAAVPAPMPLGSLAGVRGQPRFCSRAGGGLELVV